MSDQWLFIALILPLALFMASVPIGLSRLLGPRKSNPAKDAAYECGIETVGDTWVQFKVQYYIFALVFVVFDVETVFLFPFAVAFNAVSLFAVFEVTLFILILVAGLVYVWRKGALEWV